MTSKLRIQQLDPIEHILKRPDMYVGSVRVKQAEEYVGDIFQGDDGLNLSVKKENITFSPALLRIFVEALSNAIDNAKRSKDANIPASKIKIFIDKETGKTTIWNDGMVIPIELNEDTKEYKHTMIFGKLRTSTNFNDSEERTVSGRNGLGIKLTNVFSKQFTVKTVDPVSGLSFSQEWSDNMTQTVQPVIKSVTSPIKGFTQVSWIPDFAQFQIQGYTADIIRLYTRYVFDAAMLTGLSVYLNDVKLPIKSLQDYAKLFASPTFETIYIESKDSKVLLATADEFEAISFVNGVFTIQGGKHVDGWSEAFFRPIVDHFNKPKKPQVTIKDVKQFFRLFVVSTLVNPEFSSQSKTELTSPDVDAKVDKKVVSTILKWETTSKVNDIITSKELIVMKKSESKKRGFTAIEGYMPANEAGGKNSLLCTLALCEGLSAKSFVVKGMDSPYLKGNGRDYFGVYPLRGKILNVRSSNGKQIAENKEITAIIQALNLRYDLDYSKDENFATLHYGKLLILTDADTDGKHITGLIINIIHYLFPSLLNRSTPFIVNMLTPIAKFTFKGGEKIFYDLFSADAFYTANKDKHFRVKYYKGLGTHSDAEIAQEFGKRVLAYVKDEHCDESIVKAFDKKYTDTRKTWLEQYDPKKHTEILVETDDTNESILKRNISTFINEDFITYSVDNCIRAIPHVMDGLKQSQRKILYAAFLKNLKQYLKVAQFAGYVAEKTNYHHGEDNLNSTIIKMAQDFVGANNIPFLDRDGQFGSRLQKGEDAASARYIFTRLDSITRFIFREEDDVILDKTIDDGDVVEPRFYVPIIPTILINGCDGIGTGWASSIPMFNPLDVVNCVREWIKDPPQKADGLVFTSIPDLTPWCRGFKGHIEQDTTSNGRFHCHGIVERDVVSKRKTNRVQITEIPIDMSIQSCYEMLTHLVHEEKKIKHFKDYSGANTPRFVIDEFTDGLRCTAANLKLVGKINTTNMVLFDRNFKIKKCDTVLDIICEFCEVRLAYYIKRKNYLLADLQRRITCNKNKERFLSEVMDNSLVIHRRKEEDIIQDLSTRNYDKELSTEEEDKGFNYLLRLPIRHFTNEKIAELHSEIQKLEIEHQVLSLTKESDIWLKELDEFESAYRIWLSKMEKKENSGKK